MKTTTPHVTDLGPTNQTTQRLTPTEAAILDVVTRTNDIHPYSKFEGICTRGSVGVHTKNLRAKGFAVWALKKAGVYYHEHPDCGMSPKHREALDAVREGNTTVLNVARVLYANDGGVFFESDRNTTSHYLSDLVRLGRLERVRRGRYKLAEEKEKVA